MLIVFATSSAMVKRATTHRGNFCRNAPARPTPETIPIRAAIIWTQPIMGHVTNAAQEN